MAVTMFGWFRKWLRKRRLKKLRLERRRLASERAYVRESKRLREASDKAKRAKDRRHKAFRQHVDALTEANRNDAQFCQTMQHMDNAWSLIDDAEQAAGPPFAPKYQGGGGAFGGAGASGSWDDIPPDGGATAAWVAAAPHPPDYLRDVAAAHWQAHVDRHDYHAAQHNFTDHSHDHSSSGTSDWSSADSSSYCDGGSDSSGGGDT